jgi:hypothetical protein
MDYQGNNKKVIGAKKHYYDNIQFNSALEVSCYKCLKLSNIPFSYEPITFEIFKGFRLNKVNFYHQKSNSNKTFDIFVNKKKEKEKITSITLTPDFKIDNTKYLILIETKGFANDVYPYKRKLLFKYLEENLSENYEGVYYFEPRNVRQVKESIEQIKLLINE